MIRVVLDTNIVISGTLWSGTPSLIMQAIWQVQIKPVTSEVLLDELRDVLERPKFSERLILIGKTSRQIVEDFATHADVIEVEKIERTVMADEDDDQVLACAKTGHVDYVVSGDPHLLDLLQYEEIPILNVAAFVIHLAGEDRPGEM